MGMGDIAAHERSLGVIDKTNKIIEGLPAGEASEKLALMEKRYQEIADGPWWRFWWRSDAIKVLRAMILELAQGYKGLQNTLTVMPIIEARAAEYVKLKEQRDRLAEFVYQEFPVDFKEFAVARTDIFQAVQVLLLRSKRRTVGVVWPGDGEVSK